MTSYFQTLAAFASVRDPGATTLAVISNIARDCVTNIDLCLSDPKTRTDENIIVRKVSG